MNLLLEKEAQEIIKNYDYQPLILNTIRKKNIFAARI